MDNHESAWVEAKSLEYPTNYSFTLTGSELSPDVVLFFGVVHEKSQILFDYFSTSSPYNFLVRTLDYLDYVLGLHQTYDLIAKTPSSDKEKLSFLDSLGFKDYLISTKITRKIDKDSDTLPHLEGNLRYRTLNLESEIDLWHELVMESYKNAPKFRQISLSNWKSLYLDSDGKLKIDVPEDGAVVLEVDKTPVGLFIASPPDKETNWGTGSALGVVSKFRGNGYAELILKWYINYERCRGSEGSFLFTDTENVAATNLYLKLGYKLEGPDTIIKKYK